MNLVTSRDGEGITFTTPVQNGVSVSATIDKEHAVAIADYIYSSYGLVKPVSDYEKPAEIAQIHNISRYINHLEYDLRGMRISGQFAEFIKFMGEEYVDLEISKHASRYEDDDTWWEISVSGVTDDTLSIDMNGYSVSDIVAGASFQDYLKKLRDEDYVPEKP